MKNKKIKILRTVLLIVNISVILIGLILILKNKI